MYVMRHLWNIISNYLLLVILLKKLLIDVLFVVT
jgi:hypothetical protein